MMLCFEASDYKMIDVFSVSEKDQSCIDPHSSQAMQTYAMISLSYLNTWLLLYKEINSHFNPQDILKRA